MKSTSAAYAFWLVSLAGLCGLHRIYAGRYVTGIIWLLTGGLLFVGQFIDLFLIPGMIEEENRQVGYGGYPLATRLN